MKRFLNLLSTKTKFKCVGIVFLAFISAYLGSVWPVKLGEIYTSISSGKIGSVKEGLFTILTFGMIYLAAECINSCRRVILDCVIATQEAEVREKSVEKLLRMPLAFFDGNLSAEKTAQINQGINGMSQLLKIGCNDVFSTVLTAVCTLVQVLTNAPGIIALIMLTYLALTVVVSAFQIKSQNGIREKIVKKRNNYEGQICQSIGNIEMIRSLNAEDYERNRLKPSIFGIRDTEKMHHKVMGSFDALKHVCKIVFQSTLIIMSLYMISKGTMASGAVITICLLFQQLVKPVDDVYRFLDEIASSVVKAKALIEVTESKNDPIFDIESKPKVIENSGIVAEKITIRNPEDTKDLAKYDSIVINRNKKIALVGPSGCGKTTFVKSLIRYYHTSSGKISILGNNQNSYSQEEIADTIYYSPQESVFIAGSVLDNMLYGLKREVSREELIEALCKVRLVGRFEGVINEDPEVALDFVLSEGAKELSGGMKQRLALSRAFLRKPKFYIFDEITANLDSNSTDFVLGNIEDYAIKIGAGVVYISHDEKVTGRCDEILVLDNLVNSNHADKAS